MVYRGTESSMMNCLRIEPLWTLLFVGALQASVHKEQKNITAGQDVTLTCRAPNNNNIDVVEWSRPDLGDDYVLMYRHGNILPDHQHPSFKNRVDLQDRQMKDGDVSLILKNVTINDTGTYECRVFQTGIGGLKLISNITLSVVDPPGHTGGQSGGKKDGSVGLIVGLVVVFLLVVVGAFVGYWKFRKDKPQTQDSHCPPAELQIQMSDLLLNSESPADEHRDKMTRKQTTVTNTPQGSLMSL